MRWRLSALQIPPLLPTALCLLVKSDRLLGRGGERIQDLHEKAMPAHKIGRLWKFKKDEIDEWVRKGGASETSGEHDGKE